MTGANVIGLKNADGSYIVNPNINLPLESGMKLIILGNSDQINQLKKLLID
jgi:voltage-gated potassium channel